MHAKYMIERDDNGEIPEGPLLIRDVGAPWTEHLTITNDAEWVVRQLVMEGHLPEGRQLLYIDSDGEIDEIMVENGQFAGFKPGSWGDPC